MDCELIFYSARKTAFCERSLKKSFSKLNLKLSASSFANTAEMFRKKVADVLDGGSLVFIVGDLVSDDKDSVKGIMSGFLAGAGAQECFRLRSESGSGGYVVRAGKQIVVMLPDSPEQIEQIMSGVLGGYISRCTG